MAKCICQSTERGEYPTQYVSIGVDVAGRDIQIVSVWDADGQRWVVFRAMKATRKVQKELGLE